MSGDEGVTLTIEAYRDLTAAYEGSGYGQGYQEALRLVASGHCPDDEQCVLGKSIHDPCRHRVVDGHAVDAGGMSSTSDDVLIRALHAIRLNVMSERGDFGQGIDRCKEEIEKLLTADGSRNHHDVVRATYCGHGHTYCAGCYDACPYCPA